MDIKRTSSSITTHDDHIMYEKNKTYEEVQDKKNIPENW